MQALYNKIVERNLDTGSLNIDARVRITMLAQLMDLGAAVGSAPLCRRSRQPFELQTDCLRCANSLRRVARNRAGQPRNFVSVGIPHFSIE